MQITQIKVKSGGRFPHPNESFSNLEVEIELTAEVRPDEGIGDQIRELQIMVDTAYAQHKQQRLDAIEVVRKAGIAEHEWAERQSRPELDVPF